MSTVFRRYYTRAIEQQRRGAMEDAAEGFRLALETSPSFVEARIAYASGLARSGEAQRAATLVRAGLGQPDLRERERVLLLRALGDVLIAVGPAGYREAEDAYHEASTVGARIGFPQLDLHDRLARLRAKTGRFGEALGELLAAARAQKS